MEILRFNKIENGNSHEAYFDLLIPAWGNFIITNMKLYRKNSHRWILFPSQEKIDSFGNKKYFPYNSFQDPHMKKMFEKKVLAAIDDFLQKNPKS